MVFALVLQAGFALGAFGLVLASRRAGERPVKAEAAGVRRPWSAVGAALLVAFLIGGFEIAVALYVRSPRNANWLSGGVGSTASRGSARVAALLSSRTGLQERNGPTVSRRDFLRMAVPKPEER